MEKIYGTKERQDSILQTGRNKWTLFYGFGKDDEASESGWEYRHTFARKPSLEEIKELVVTAINARTEEKILNGFEWAGKSVYLSKENQLNFAAIERSEGVTYPLSIKVSEDADGSAEYMTFATKQDFVEFSQAASLYVLSCVQEGWTEKDSVDWDKLSEGLQ